MTLAVPWNFAATIQPEQLDVPDIGPGAFQSPDDAVKYATKVLYPGFRRERDRLRRIDMWYKGIQADPNVPRGATRELRSLLALSKTPWLGLVVTTIAQTMFVDGYRSPQAAENTPGPWMTWQANDFDVRQTAIHRAALGYGYSYATALPGLAPDGSSRSVLRGISPKRMFAVYEDPAADDFPQFAIRMDPTGQGNFMAKLYDDTFEHTLKMTATNTFTYIGAKAHSAGVCPVVRYTNMLDLDGATPGEVEPFIPIASRIDKTIFDRLMTQHFLSWKVRYIAGLANFAESEEEANVKKFKLRQQDILVSEDPDTKFGTIDGSDPTPLIASAEADIEALAAVSQMPSHVLTGKMINLSAEALAASRAPLTQKVAERQTSFGASHSRLLRLASKLEGDTDAANDVLARVTWQDMEIRSLSQAADALGKLAQMLGVPREDLWERIPGVTQSDIAEWKTHALDDNPLSAYLRGIEYIRTTPSGDAIIGASPLVREDAAGVAPPIPSVHP